MANATNTSLGEIKLAGDLAGSTNALAPELTPTAVTPGTYALPTITVDSKGRVTSAVAGTGTALAAILPMTSTTVVGIGSFNPVNFTVNSGVVSLNTSSLPLAAAGTPGVVQTGANITNTDGVISIPAATASTPGVVQTGANITNTGGVISIPVASSSVAGVASFNPVDFTVANGVVSLISGNLGLLNVQNTWQKTQSYAVSPLTFSATVTPDFSQSNVFSLTATGNFTLANPTNVVPGTTYLLIITQDATGGRAITWGSNFKFATGAPTTLSATGGKRDIISVVAITASTLLVTSQLGF